MVVKKINLAKQKQSPVATYSPPAFKPAGA